MSIILDALKKSESDQQRQSGPALFEVKVAPPKARFPVWAVAIVALLVVNMLIVGYLLLRRGSRAEETAATNNSLPAAAAAQAIASVATAPTPPPPAAPAVAPPPAAAPAITPAPTAAPATTPQLTAAPATAPEPVAQAPANGPTPQGPTLADRARDAAGSEPPANPDDYAPATEGDSSALFKGHVKRGTDSGLVLYQDAAVVPGANLPQLRLDLHVYAAKPQDRFALINMHKLHEGDSLPEGVRVESITPDGVVMSHNGSRFLLPRE